MCKDGELSEKHKAFIDYFFSFCNRNVTTAYGKAYPNANIDTCYKKGKILLEKVQKSEYFALKEAEYDLKCADNFTKRQTWLEEIAERCMQKKPVMEYDKEEKQMVPTGEWVFDSRGAIAAINELNKMEGNHAETKIKLNQDKETSTSITMTDDQFIKFLNARNN